MLRNSIKTMIALFFAFFLRGLTYALGNFDFSSSPLFSLEFFCDWIILLIYYILSLFVIAKIRNKKNIAKDKKYKNREI